MQVRLPCASEYVASRAYLSFSACIHRQGCVAFLRSNAHNYLHQSVTSERTCVCVQNRYESVRRFHKWTSDLPGTRWRQANLAHIVYLSLRHNDWDGRVVFTRSSCAAPKPGSRRLGETICLAHAGPNPSSRVTSSGRISCLVLGKENLNLDLGWRFECLYLEAANEMKQPYSKWFLQIGKVEHIGSKKWHSSKSFVLLLKRWFQEGSHWKQTNSPLCSVIVTAE